MLVIGNGESRTGIDIDIIDDTKIGCNAIMRDSHVDYLVCVDRRMVEEAILRNVNLTGTFVYTRPDWYPKYKTLKIRELPPLPYSGAERWDEPFQWGSGPYAVLIASMYAKEPYINLIGFDLHSNTNTVNNIYKSTPNYDTKDKRAVDPRYWIHQIGKVFECFPNIQFTIYQDDSWQLPQAWKLPNVKVDNISNIYYNT